MRARRGRERETHLVELVDPPSSVISKDEDVEPLDGSSSNADHTGEDEELPSVEEDERGKAEDGTEPEERSWSGGEEVEVEVEGAEDATKEDRRVVKAEVKLEKVEEEVEVGLVEEMERRKESEADRDGERRREGEGVGR